MSQSHTPRKRFGQNFLQDHELIHKITRALRLQANQQLVEIGPGLGALTFAVLATGAQLTAIEIDIDLVNYLNKKALKLPTAQQFNLIEADALTFDFSQLISSNHKLKIFGNLPYNISTPLLFHLMQYLDHIQDMTFMLQKEVIQRICATPHSKEYGRLSIMLQYYCYTQAGFDIPPHSFYPQPKVMSSLVHLTPRPVAQRVLNRSELSLFQQLVATAFSARRKTINNALKTWGAKINWASLGINPQARPENISGHQFVQLTQHIAQHTLPNP